MVVGDYEILTVKANERNSMERFFRDNSIPFIVAEDDGICTSFRLRAGMDYNDALLYNLKTYGDLNDSEIYDTINMLVLEHEFWDVKYDYECYAAFRKDESLLNTPLAFVAKS